MTTQTQERLDLIRSMPVPVVKMERYRHKLSEAAVGTFFRYGGRTYKVTGKATWTAPASSSTELEVACLETGETSYFEWWYDLKLYASRSVRQVEWRELGIAESSLSGLDAVSVGGVEYAYDDDYEAGYEAAGGRKSAYLYALVNGDMTLSVQKWADGYDAWISETVDPAKVEILVLGAAQVNG